MLSMDGRLQVGDRLLTIDGQPLSGLSTSDALNRLKSVIAKNLNEYHPCVHLLIARRRHKLTNSDDSYANSVEDTSENSTHSKMLIIPHQHKSISEVVSVYIFTRKQYSNKLQNVKNVAFK
ncbi:unnamed protein product [Trichobilharzia regenti]|nr:unnamed protein product [Trichobilharzia regenti]